MIAHFFEFIAFLQKALPPSHLLAHSIRGSGSEMMQRKDYFLKKLAKRHLASPTCSQSNCDCS